MKKFILLPILLMTCAVVTGCKSDKQASVPTTGNVECKVTIQAHLDAADMKGRGEKTITKGNNIVVDYVGRLSDQEVFDTSVESIAKACGKYTAGRDYTGGLAFQVGGGQMIPGFDKGVEGMKLGQTKTITIPAKEAYGEWSKDKLIAIDKTKIPDAEKYAVGMQVMADYGQVFKVYEVTATQIIFDGNHELAGKDLIFDITIKEIK
jgi:FKBP-type peptidyl-prolyl cis-trans isomerase 2